MRVPSLNKYCVLLVYFSFLANAADRIFSGSLERVTHASITLRLPDDLTVDATLPAGFAVPFHIADQVEIACAPTKTTYDATAGLHYHLQLRTLRLLRPASPQEQSAMIESLSWQPGENLLESPRAPVSTHGAVPSGSRPPGESGSSSKPPDFVADEVTRLYRSYDVGRPWRLERTIQDVITVKDNRLTAAQGARMNKQLSASPDFGLHLDSLFNPQCAAAKSTSRAARKRTGSQCWPTSSMPRPATASAAGAQWKPTDCRHHWPHSAGSRQSPRPPLRLPRRRLSGEIRLQTVTL